MCAQSVMRKGALARLCFLDVTARLESRLQSPVPTSGKEWHAETSCVEGAVLVVVETAGQLTSATGPETVARLWVQWGTTGCMAWLHDICRWFLSACGREVFGGCCRVEYVCMDGSHGWGCSSVSSQGAVGRHGMGLALHHT